MEEGYGCQLPVTKDEKPIKGSGYIHYPFYL